MKGTQRVISNQTATILVCLLFVLAAVCLRSDKVYATEQALLLSLHSQNPQENVHFQLSNMFPGDSITQNYRLSVSYTGAITVCFHATAGSGDEKLSEVLEIKVQLADTGELLYEGVLADMPMLGRKLSTDSNSQTEELIYEITVGLSTSVGNEYQDKKLTVDLSWWAEGADNPDEPTEPSVPEGEDKPTEPSVPGGEDDPTEPSEPEEVEGGSLIDLPETGDNSRIMMWLAVVSVTMAAMIVMLMRYHRREQLVVGQSSVSKSKTRLVLGIFLAVLLIIAFGITSLALVYRKVTVEENLFQTGQVSISLNDNQPVFNEDMLFEPGMVVEKDFTLRNDSSCDVYYRLYFSDISGELAEAMTVRVTDGEDIIFRGKMSEMNGVKSEGAAGLLKEEEERTMKITFHVPENCGNVMQGGMIEFDLNADAVQMVNNPDGLFE